MKNILIPTDFSENAWNAIEYALALFEKEECNINLLNTYTPAIASAVLWPRRLKTECLKMRQRELLKKD